MFSLRFKSNTNIVNKLRCRMSSSNGYKRSRMETPGILSTLLETIDKTQFGSKVEADAKNCIGTHHGKFNFKPLSNLIKNLKNENSICFFFKICKSLIVVQ